MVVEVEDGPTLEEAGASTAPTPGFVPTTSPVDNATATPGSFRHFSASPSTLFTLFHLPPSLHGDFLPRPSPAPWTSSFAFLLLSRSRPSPTAPPPSSSASILSPLPLLPSCTTSPARLPCPPPSYCLLRGISSRAPCCSAPPHPPRCARCCCRAAPRRRRRETERGTEERDTRDVLFVQVGSNRQPSGWKGRDGPRRTP